MNTLFQATLWLLFFASTIYGHVAFKLVAHKQTILLTLWQAVFSFWGLTATLAWGLSGALWILILAETPLVAANSVSALRYVLVALAAILFLQETMTLGQGLGMIFIALGIYLVISPS